jgi:hypothetical protein
MWSAMSELEAGSSPQDHACASIAPETGFPCLQSILSDYTATSRGVEPSRT